MGGGGVGRGGEGGGDAGNGCFCSLTFIFIYLFDSSGLGCGMQDLLSSSRYVGSVAAACKLLVVAYDLCDLQFPDQGLNMDPLH